VDPPNGNDCKADKGSCNKDGGGDNKDQRRNDMPQLTHELAPAPDRSGAQSQPASGPTECGYAFIYHLQEGAFIGIDADFLGSGVHGVAGIQAGHTAWGVYIKDRGAWFGQVIQEGPDGRPLTAEHSVESISAMHEIFRRSGYEDYAISPVYEPACDLDAAKAAFRQVQESPYQAFSANCADATKIILEKFGARGLLELDSPTRWAPNGWFNQQATQQEWTLMRLRQ
jgi:hypothetical protein